MTNGHNGDNWGGFSWWNTRAEETPPDSADDDHRRTSTEEHEETSAGAGAGEAGAAREGRWVSQGGVLRWEAPEGEDEERNSRAEANSPWAEEEVDLPSGAPETLRLRATHAWLVRQRALEAEAQGLLLLERRKIQEPEEDESAVSPRRGSVEESPLEVALAEHQAAIEEDERLIGQLDEDATH